MIFTIFSRSTRPDPSFLSTEGFDEWSGSAAFRPGPREWQEGDQRALMGGSLEAAHSGLTVNRRSAG